MQQVFVIGGTTFDHIVHLEQLPAPVPTTIHQAIFHEGCGSTGAGKALALTKLGVPNTLYSVIGDDAYGMQIASFLQESGIDFFYTIDPKGTERHINIMDAAGGRISMFVTQSSEHISHNISAIQHAINAADILVLNIISYCRQLIPLVKGQSKPVWTDLHDYDGSNPYHQDFIDAAQYIHLSSDNLSDYQTVMQLLIQQGKELVICTHGKQGASLLTKKGEWIEQTAYPVKKIVDSNGAGDSFFAGFLFGWMQSMPLQLCMQYGAVCGALAVEDQQLVNPELTPLQLHTKQKQWLQ
jgi:sugar/nucleoside kinase (ribokinase family)